MYQVPQLWVGGSMNNSPSQDLYAVGGEGGIFAIYISTYKCIWHNCWDPAALTWLSLICFLLNHYVYIALSCFSSILKCTYSIWGRYLQCTAPSWTIKPSRVFMRCWRSGTWVPTNTLLDPSVFQGSVWFPSSNHTLSQCALSPVLIIRQGFAVHRFAAVQWKADATWLSQIG